jgi:chemotaxis signal transduction protein
MPVPVIDAGALFGESRTPRRRLVTVDVGGRLVALAVDEVVGIGEMAEDMPGELPPLLREATAEAIRTIGVLDGEFLLRLEASRLVSDDALDALGLVMPNT